MRVTGGTARGRVLTVPKGARLRPTSDMVRQAIFNVVGDAVVGAAVLDLYAGSGALAVEALSRGAERAELVEVDPAARQAIRRNLETAECLDRGTIWPMTVERALPKLGAVFDLVLADPPYELEGIGEVMESLGRGDLIAPAGIAVLEHGKRFDVERRYGKLERRQQKQYGDTRVSFFQFDRGE